MKYNNEIILAAHSGDRKNYPPPYPPLKMLCVLARTFKIIINHACEAVGIVRGFALHVNAQKSEIIHFVDIRWGKIHLKIATKNDSLKNLCQNGQ